MAGAAVTPATPAKISVVAAARIRVQASGPGTFYTVSISVTAMSDVQIDRVDCFLQGTRILTPNGEMAVEALPTGDAVLTQSGAVRPIRYCNAHEQAHGNGTPHAEKIHYVCERQYRWTPVWAAS
jgi:hypothetical protein